MATQSVSHDSPTAQPASAGHGPPVRIAFVGFGFVGDVQARALQQVTGAEIVAVADIKPDRLKHAQDKFGVRSVYADWKQMLRDVRPDAVSVCTPNGGHVDPTIDACNAGCHVMVEKPMAMNPAECERMIAAARAGNVSLTVGFQYRYHPVTRFLVQARDEGAFGNVMFVKCQALRRRGIPNWGVFGQKKLQGGGPMIDIGVHIIEMAHYVMGSPRPVAASGNTWTYLGDKPSSIQSVWPNWDHQTYTVEDLAIGQIRFDNGAIMQIETAFAAHIEKDTWNFTLMGDKGGCSFDPPRIFTDRAGHMTNIEPGWLSPKSGFEDLFVVKMQKWIDAIRARASTEAPGEAGLAVQKILDGVYRSAEAGREVAIG